ncbi:MAG: YobI family P-loop NTPase [Senegalia sp. (in: firmicutes)]|uniref:YobI family P-loop NTPase n=1 Tax=Senegalia sp. (in: firmicutes) TaxID=1924098 RepID=UPI003F9838B7
MTNRTINYQKLTPTIAENINYYEEFLDYAYSEKELLNIALTGRYGAGKSSAWEGYEKKI